VRNIRSVSIKIRFLAMVSVLRHEMTNGKRGVIPLLPLISEHWSPSRGDRERCAFKGVDHG
jgi:hypothetical protein